MYVIWLQGNTSEGYYKGEQNGRVLLVSNWKHAVHFPSERAAQYKADALYNHEVNVRGYEICRVNLL